MKRTEPVCGWCHHPFGEHPHGFCPFAYPPIHERDRVIGYDLEDKA